MSFVVRRGATCVAAIVVVVMLFGCRRIEATVTRCGGILAVGCGRLNPQIDCAIAVSKAIGCVSDRRRSRREWRRLRQGGDGGGGGGRRQRSEPDDASERCDDDDDDDDGSCA